MPALALITVTSLVLAADPKPPTAEALAQAVVALIKKQDRKVMVDVVEGETSWSDSAVLERNRQFPHSIATLIKSPSPDRKVEAGKIASLIESYQQHRDGYVGAKVERTGPECFIVAGATRALVNCTYVDYLQARYAKATFFVHGAFDPVLFVEKDRVHALLMPMKR